MELAGGYHVNPSEPIPISPTVKDTENFERANSKSEPQSRTTHGPLNRLVAALMVSAENFAQRLAARYIPMLNKQRERVRRELRVIPDRMQRVTNQARLVLDLIDDFDSGAYRAVPWHTIAVAAAALLYSVSPSDVLPDVIPAVGAIDDIAVIALAMRIIRRDLEAYCRFKGYDPAEYF